jgi:hypothetical protein
MNIPAPKTGSLQIGPKEIKSGKKKSKFNVDFVETGFTRRTNFTAVRNSVTTARDLCTNKIKTITFPCYLDAFLRFSVPGSVTLIGVYSPVNKTHLGQVWLSLLRRLALNMSMITFTESQNDNLLSCFTHCFLLYGNCITYCTRLGFSLNVPSATYFSGGYFWPLSVSRLHRGGGQDDW